LLQINKEVLSVIKEWSKPTNVNRSKKLSIISYYFILGKQSGIKSRIKEGHFLTNLNSTIESGFQSYMAFLHPIVNAANNEKKLFNVADNSNCSIYQLLTIPNPKTGGVKHYCELFQKTSIKNVYAFLEDVFKGLLGVENYKTDPSNMEDYKSLFFFKGQKDYPIQHLVIKTDIKSSNNEYTTSWHLLGLDNDSMSNVYYSVAQEFQILPFPQELGQIEKILP